MKLTGKIAVVTGASRGIGRGIAEVLAEEGADIAVNYISNLAEAEETAQLVRDKGGRAIVIQRRRFEACRRGGYVRSHLRKSWAPLTFS